MSLDKNEIFNDEGYNESKKREYHAGYKQGYRDACEDRYWLGWYSGMMMGVLLSFGGILMYTTNKKSKLTLF